MKIAVIGQGYVGLPLSVAAAEADFSVVGIDLNSEKVKSISSGHSGIEDISDSQIKNILKKKIYKVTDNYSELIDAEIIVICVPTPLNKDHKPDLTFLESSVTSIAANMKEGALVILESTVSPGTTRNIVEKILNQSGISYLLAYSPERIDPANPVWNIKNTPKLVAGINEQSTKTAVNFYKKFVKEVIAKESIEVVETAKLLENTFRLINISFVQEIAEFCHKMNIDVREVIDAASSKPYGFMPFYPGVGVGGHCIPVDPAYLTAKADELGSPMQLTKKANEINLATSSYFVKVAKEKLGDLRGKSILVVGIAYKPNVSDIRESAGIELIRKLRSEGGITSWHDDLVSTWNSEKSSPLENQFDLVILANPHSNTNLDKIPSEKLLNTRGGY